MVFIVQRFDATSFSPNEETDPEFEDDIRQASSGRAKVFACCCPINPKKTAIRSRVPVLHLQAGTYAGRLLAVFWMESAMLLSLECLREETLCVLFQFRSRGPDLICFYVSGNSWLFSANEKQNSI